MNVPASDLSQNLAEPMKTRICLRTAQVTFTGNVLWLKVPGEAEWFKSLFFLFKFQYHSKGFWPLRWRFSLRCNWVLTQWGNTDIYRLDEDICSRGVYQTYPPSCSEHLLSGMKCSSVAVLSSVYSLSCTRLVMFGGFTISAALNPGFPGRLAPGELPFPGVWHSGQVHWRGWSLRWWAYRNMQFLTVPQKQHLIWPAEKHEHIFERNLKVLWN